jgi:hypothetical protein
LQTLKKPQLTQIRWEFRSQTIVHREEGIGNRQYAIKKRITGNRKQLYNPGAIGTFLIVEFPTPYSLLPIFRHNISLFIKTAAIARATRINSTSDITRTSIVFTGNVTDKITHPFQIVAFVFAAVFASAKLSGIIYSMVIILAS